MSLRTLIEGILGRASGPDDHRAAFSTYTDQSGLYFRLDPRLSRPLEKGEVILMNPAAENKDRRHHAGPADRKSVV